MDKIEKLRRWNNQWPHWKFTGFQNEWLTELFGEYDRLRTALDAKDQEAAEQLTHTLDGGR